MSATPDLPASSALPSQIVRLGDQASRGDHPVRIEPDAPARDAIAAHLGIPGIRKLRFDGKLIPQGRRDWLLEATLGATVIQDCVITLAPVTTRIDEKVIRRYLADFAEPGPGEVEMPEDDTAESLPASLDLAGVMIEALSLALPPFPRAEGAAIGSITITEPGKAPLDQDSVKPFAGLRDLRSRLDPTDAGDD